MASSIFRRGNMRQLLARVADATGSLFRTDGLGGGSR